MFWTIALAITIGPILVMAGIYLFVGVLGLLFGLLLNKTFRTALFSLMWVAAVLLALNAGSWFWATVLCVLYLTVYPWEGFYGQNKD